ncbi:MAG: hypothetical protein PHC69_08200 [Ruminiclostridium sp.]|nr:hypothetical protein [Ruminiclostridium sp.]
MAYTGNIPVAAGLSSFSAIVVATSEAAVALNNLEVKPQKFVDSLISPQYAEVIKRIMKSHKTPEEYEIRSVLMYGIAECRRSFICGKLLEKGDLEGFGRMMNISHDGDRVAKLDLDKVATINLNKVAALDLKNIMQKFEYDISDNALNALINDLRSEDVSRVYSAQIENQPGGYAYRSDLIF